MDNLNQKKTTLNNGLVQPSLGFGTWQSLGEDCVEAVKYALEVGYRHIDTAVIYGNHKQIGEAITSSVVKREEIFLTTKIWRSSLTKDALNESFDQSLIDLQTDYVDQLLIHWPDSNSNLQETLETMEDIRKSGKAKSIGVSNFTINHVKDALKLGISLQVNQVEIHPSMQQTDLVEFCHENRLNLTAYSPLGQGDDLKLPQIIEVAKKYDLPPSKIVISFLLSQGLIVIPKATKRENILSNFEAESVNLKPEDIELIKTAEKNYRLINPDFAEFGY